MRSFFMKNIAKEGSKELKEKGYVKSGFSLGIESTKFFIGEMKKYDLLKIRDYKRNLVIFHGTDDNTIPLKNSYIFKNNNKNANIEIIEIKGAHHVMNNETIDIYKSIIERICL